MPAWCLNPVLVAALWALAAGVLLYRILPAIFGLLGQTRIEIRDMPDDPLNNPGFEDNSPASQLQRMGMQRLGIHREHARFFLGRWSHSSKPVQLYRDPEGREYAAIYQIYTGETRRVAFITYLHDRKITTANSYIGPIRHAQFIRNSFLTGNLQSLRDRHRTEVASHVGTGALLCDHCSIDRYTQGEVEFDHPAAIRTGREVAFNILKLHACVLIIAVFIAHEQFGLNSALAPLVVMMIGLLKPLLELQIWFFAIVQRFVETAIVFRFNP